MSGAGQDGGKDEAGAAPPGAGLSDDDDDQRWFDLMAGLDVVDARPGTRHEAVRLRAAMLAHAKTLPAGSMPDPADRAQRLVARARRAGVLPQEPSSSARAASRADRWNWLRRPVFAGTAGLGLASVLAVMALRVNEPPPAQPDTERGAALQVLTVADPAAEQQALLQRLRAVGLDARPFERIGRAGVDVALPVPLTPGQAQALRRSGLQPPGGPALQVELVERALPGAARFGTRP